MRRCNWKSLLAGACVVLAASCSKSKNKEAEANLGPTFREGEVIVQAKNIDEVLKQREGLKAEPVWVELNMYTVAGKSIAGSEKEFADMLLKKNLAEIAEPNKILSMSAQKRELTESTTDPYWLDLWGLSNIGQDAPNGTEGKERADMGALEAWKKLWAEGKTIGSDEVLVAVMDTGIDYGHPDLKDNIYINKNEFSDENFSNKKDDDPEAEKICIDAKKKRCYADDVYGWNFVSGTNENLYAGVPGSPDPMDGNGHGTHVAGTIGALADNSEGVVGINHKVKMIALKVLSDEGSGDTDDIIRAIRYAALKKVHLVNASFGGGGESKGFMAALEQAEKAGVLFIAAAGNDASDNDEAPAFPASYDIDGVLSVAATDNRDQLAEFSNYGYQKVDLAAPGVNIKSTYPRQLARNEGTENDPYRVFSGTSMATPHVVGAAALVLAEKKELRGNPKALKKLLMESSDWRPQLAGRVRSGGRLNVAKALAGETVNFLDEKKWEELPYSWEDAPSYPEAHVDVMHTVTQKGAKAIQVHISSSLMDPIDLAAVYDSGFRLVSFIPRDLATMIDRKIDYWTPVVYGESVSLRFANALVTVTDTEKQTLTYEEMSELGGEATCFPTQATNASGEQLYECSIVKKTSDPFGNNRSEGFIIDKIRVLK